MNVKILYDRLCEAAKRDGFQMETYGAVGDYTLPAFTRQGPEGARHVYISAGVHGDEPAGPMTLLELFRQHLLPSDISFSILPMVNPFGLEQKMRENKDEVDINRDYGCSPDSYEARVQMDWLKGKEFDLSICLHEDYDGEGFYLYELANESHDKSISEAAIQNAGEFVGIDPREEIDGMPAKNGMMYPPISRLQGATEDLPEAIFLKCFNSHYCYTTETPSGALITHRIQAQISAVLTLISKIVSS